MISFEKKAQIVGAFYGCVCAAAYVSAARWLWPWLGPKLLQPCPLPTVSAQVLLAAFGLWVGRSWAIDVMVQTEVKRRRPETIEKAIKEMFGETSEPMDSELEALARSMMCDQMTTLLPPSLWPIGNGRDAWAALTPSAREAWLERARRHQEEYK